MKVLVTGHEGYIGSVLTQVLRSAGHEVVGLDVGLYRAATFGAPPAGPALQAHDVDVVLALMVDVRRVRVELLFLDAIRRYRAAVADLRRSIGGPLPAAPPGAATSPK